MSGKNNFMKKVFLALMAITTIALTGCEKGKDEPKQNNGHEAVDLGLSVKWATCNVGASKPEEYGDYFAWGETSPKTSYDWSTYKYMQNGKSSWEYITKYTIPNYQKSGIWYNGDIFVGDNKTTLDLSDDAAHVNWGGNWRMPTKEEWEELETKCTLTWTQKSGIKGCEVKGSNGNSIFLPASGCRDYSSLYGVGSFGLYWSSSLGGSYCSYEAYDLHFNSDNVGWYYWYRYDGQSVRPVCQ